VQVTLNPGLSAGTNTSVINSPRFRVPTGVAEHGSRLAMVNAAPDTGQRPVAG
jgi:hypothetical protein